MLFYFQNIQFNDNIFQDGDTSQFVKTKLQSLELKTEAQGKLDINNTASPITLNIKNKEENFDKRNVSMRLPGMILSNITKEENNIDQGEEKLKQTLEEIKEMIEKNIT